MGTGRIIHTVYHSMGFSLKSQAVWTPLIANPEPLDIIILLLCIFKGISTLLQCIVLHYSYAIFIDLKYKVKMELKINNINDTLHLFDKFTFLYEQL